MFEMQKNVTCQNTNMFIFATIEEENKTKYETFYLKIKMIRFCQILFNE